MSTHLEVYKETVSQNNEGGKIIFYGSKQDGYALIII